MNLKDLLRKFIKDDRTFFGVLVLILISVGTTIIDVVVPTGRVNDICDAVSTGLTVVFVIELIVRWYVADSFWKFIKDCWIEILAVIPVTRTFRLLRLMRLMRLVSWE